MSAMKRIVSLAALLLLIPGLAHAEKSASMIPSTKLLVTAQY
jgi:hypothetical protein